MSRTHTSRRLLAGVFPLILIASGSAAPASSEAAATAREQATTLAGVTPAFAGDLPFDCPSLQAVVAEATTRFNKITGISVISETEADITARLGPLPQDTGRKYTRRVYAADTPLPGAKHCELVDTWHVDAASRVSQIAYVCRYPGVMQLSAAFNAQLAQCLDRPSDPDADTTFVAIDIDTVASGEGYASTQVTAVAQPADGMRISVLQTICETRREGGCDDGDVD